MILANKNGWLILVDMVRKTRSGTHVKPIDNEKTFFVSNMDCDRKLFDDATEATAFVEAGSSKKKLKP